MAAVAVSAVGRVGSGQSDPRDIIAAYYGIRILRWPVSSVASSAAELWRRDQAALILGIGPDSIRVSERASDGTAIEVYRVDVLMEEEKRELSIWATLAWMCRAAVASLPRFCRRSFSDVLAP